MRGKALPHKAAYFASRTINRLPEPRHKAQTGGMTHSIGIIGAGIGGLAAATLLAQSGHRVTIAERFATPQPVGSGLVVQPVGMAVLDALGAGTIARALGAPIRRMRGLANGRVVLGVDYRADAPGMAMHRAALFAVLWDAAIAAGVRMETGAVANAAPLSGRQRCITRIDAASLGPFDLVVDASGAGSTLSPLTARALPFGAIWGHVPWPEFSNLPTDHLSQRYTAANRMAGILPIGRLPDDPTPRAAVFWSLPARDLALWPSRDITAWRADVAAFWPDIAPFLTTLRHADQMTPARYTHGTLHRPYARSLAFIGDAAHRASPQLGQGANMALLDAMALTLALRAGPLADALPHYAHMRRWHLRVYQTMSAVFTPMYQSESRILPILRDHFLAPASQVWPMPGLLSRLVSGDLVPALASTRWP